MILARRTGDPFDLSDAQAQVAAGDRSAAALLEDSLRRANEPACAHAFVRLFPASARAQAAAVDQAVAAGAPCPPLGGLAVSVKDLFDVAGQPSTGGSAVLADATAASVDCPAVARLRAAGAALLGHSNLSEFAFSGLGLNPHHGTPANPVTAALDPTPRVPGGSTSGGAVSVATGAAWAALGSDTGGSIRIPAALQGLVGFKNTQRLTPLQGAIPLSPSLDTVCAITRSVRDAVRLHEVLAARQVALALRPPSQWRLAMPTTLLLDGLEAPVAQAFEQALRRLRQAGMLITDITLPELAELASLNANGGLPAAESWAWHQDLLARDGARYDPRVATRIRRGAGITADAVTQLHRARRDWISRVESRMAPFDALLAPTVPRLAPPIAPLLADDAAFFSSNALMLRNPSIVNFLDGCAISLPCHPSGGWPVGLMAFAPALHDDRLLSLALAIEAALAAEA